MPRALTGTFVTAVLGICLSISSIQALAIDRIPLPPERQEFSSPSSEYSFVISTPDGWRSKRAIAKLFQLRAGTRGLLWKRTLPHEFGPRYVLVGDGGQVLLLDEWINVASRYTVMLLSRNDELITEHDFDAVQRILSVPGADIVRMARSGLWITSAPVLDASGRIASVETGGRVLTIDLTSGRLSTDARP